MIIERSGMDWNGMCRSSDGITDRFRQDEREWMEYLRVKSNQSNKLEIDFHRAFRNASGSLTFRRYGISKYHQYSIFENTFQCH